MITILRDSTLSNHAIILPNLPDPPSEIRRSGKDKFKKELKPDQEVNHLKHSSAFQFDMLANLFSIINFSSAEADTGNLIPKIKKFLPPLANLAKQAAGNTRQSSQKTVSTLTKELNVLKKILQVTTSADHLSNSDKQKIYSLMDVHILMYIIK